jgi:hypothetical protein
MVNARKRFTLYLSGTIHLPANDREQIRLKSQIGDRHETAGMFGAGILNRVGLKFARIRVIPGRY